MKVEDVMTTNARTCQPGANLAEATEIMWNADCGILPVVARSGVLVGVITDRDICVAVGTRGRLASDLLVKEVMTGNLFTCTPGDHIRDALDTMRAKKVRRLVVADHEGKVAGILSIDDVAVVAEAPSGNGHSELTFNDVAITLKAICARPLTETPVGAAFAAAAD